MPYISQEKRYAEAIMQASKDFDKPVFVATEIGITGGGKDNHMLYLNGLETEKVMTKDIINKIVSLVEEKVSNL